MYLTQEDVPQELWPSIPAYLDPWAIRAKELRERPTPSANILDQMSTQEYNNFVIAGYHCKAEVIRQNKKWEDWAAEQRKISPEEREAMFAEARKKADEKEKLKVEERQKLRLDSLLTESKMKVLRA